MNSLFSSKKLPKKGRKARKVNSSSSIKANSYTPPTSKQRNDKSKNTRKKTHFRKRIIRLTIVSLISVVVAVIAWNNLRINHVIMSSPQERYIDVVERYLNRNPVASLKPLVSTSAIIDDILNTFPEVASVTLKIPLFGERVEVNIIAREDQLVLKTGDNNYYIVDQDGYAYAKYDSRGGFDGVLILEDDTDVDYGSATTGQFVSPSLVEFIQAINRGLSANEIYKGQSFSYRITDEARVVYAMPSMSKYEIKFQQDTSAEQQIDNLNNSLSHLNKSKVVPLQYIDVRVNGTVYYK